MSLLKDSKENNGVQSTEAFDPLVCKGFADF